MPGAPTKSRRVKTAPGGAPTLREIQEAFQRAVIEGDDAVLDFIPPNSRTGNEVLIGVYRHAYAARLADIAASDYANVCAYMGDEEFRRLARAFLAANPSHTPNARWFSHGLPEFLAETGPYRHFPELAELARIERAIAGAFDAADDPVASLDALRQVPPEQWEGLTFAPHASVERIDCATNAFDLWSALKDETTPPATAAVPELQRLIVWREGTASKVRALGPEEAMLWDEAAKGVPFGALCELAAVFDDPDTAALRAARALQGWLVAGMLKEAVLATPA